MTISYSIFSKNQAQHSDTQRVISQVWNVLVIRITQNISVYGADLNSLQYPLQRMQYVLVSVITYRVIVTYRHYCFYKYYKDSLDYCKCKPRNFRCQKDEKFFFITKEINLVTWEFSLTRPLSQNTLTSLSFVDSFKLRYVCIPHNIYSARVL